MSVNKQVKANKQQDKEKNKLNKNEMNAMNGRLNIWVMNITEYTGKYPLYTGKYPLSTISSI